MGTSTTSGSLLSIILLTFARYIEGKLDGGGFSDAVLDGADDGSLHGVGVYVQEGGEGASVGRLHILIGDCHG